MTDKIRNLLEDVQTVYEGKGMVVHPNSFDQLRMEVIKLDNITVQQSEHLIKAKEIIGVMRHLLFDVWGYIDSSLEKRVNDYLKQSNS